MINKTRSNHQIMKNWKQTYLKMSYKEIFSITNISFNNDDRLVAKLEDFCCRGEFTSIMNDFSIMYAHKFEDTEDQNIE